MSFVLANRVKETSLSTGSGDLTLLGAVAGYQSFADVVSSGDTTYYTIVNLDKWEVGLGTYGISSLSRTEVLSSSNNDAKIDLSGQSYVFICYPSEKSVYKNSNDQIVVTSSGIRFSDGTIQLTASSGDSGGGVYYAGTGLILSGSTFHESGIVLRSGDNISLLSNNLGFLTSHPSIPGIGNTDSPIRSYVHDIFTDSNGHVTGIIVEAETGLPYFAGDGLILNGFGVPEYPAGYVFSVDGTVARSGSNISIFNNNAGFLTSHPNVNAASSVDNTNSGQYRYYIQDVFLDSYGHVTGLSTGEETVIQLQYYAGTGIQIDNNTVHIDDTVIVSGDNISLLNNDIGYLTSHPTISSASTSNNSGRTYIQDIFLDTNGHVTGLATATETVVDTDTTYTAGTGLLLNGTIFSLSGQVLRAGDNISLLVNNTGYLTSHPSISGVSSSNSGRVYIQSILTDPNGHVTGISTATESGSSSPSYTAGSGLLLTGSSFSTFGTGVFSSIQMLSQIPNITSDSLYNNGGVLYFNGSPVGQSSSYTGSGGIGVSDSSIYSTGSLNALSTLLWTSGIEVPVFTGVEDIGVLRVGSSSGNIPVLDSSGWISTENLEPGIDFYTYRSVVPSAIILSIASPTYRDLTPITISDTGIWKLKYFYNCKSAISLTYTGRVLFTSGCISGVTGQIVGNVFGNGTPAVQLLTFSGSSGLLAGTGRAGVNANISTEAVVTLTGTGMVIPGITTNNATATGTLMSGFLEMIKIA